MGDWEFSRDRVQAAPPAIRAEAKVWDGKADTMTEVRGRLGALGLQMSAFSCVMDLGIGSATAADLHNGYQKMYDWMDTLLQQAAQQFDGMAGALRKNADAYEHVDAHTAQNFDKIAKG